VIRKIGAYAVARIASGGLLYITLVALLYLLDKKSYELFSAGYAAAQLIGTLAFGWIFVIIPHMISGFPADQQAQRQADLVSAFVRMSVLALAASGIAFATGALDLPWPVVVSLAATVVVAGASDQAMTVLAAKEQPRRYLHVAIARYGVGLLAAVTAAAFGMGTPGVFFGLAAGALVALVIADRSLQLRAGGFNRLRLGELGRLLATGLPAVIAFGLYPLAIVVNRLTVAQTCSLEAAAALGAVNDLIAGPVLLIFQIINLALTPALFAAANRGDAPAFSRTLRQIVSLQAAMIIPGALFFFFFGGMIGSVLRLSSLPPVAADMLPYVAIAVLFSVPINTAAGVALARKKLTVATGFSLLVITASVLLGMRQNCDVMGIAKTLTALMALSSVVGMVFLYRLRVLPNSSVPPAAADPASTPPGP
jgi:O-antigen/teichoic acid export membrane protein